MSQSRINTGGPAFPIECYISGGIMQTEGMSLRAWFAGQALKGMLSNPNRVGNFPKFEDGAKDAYRWADAMIAIEIEAEKINSDIQRKEMDEDHPF